jgi:hypothetical protein
MRYNPDMSEKVTLDLPEDLATRARMFAAQVHRPFEEVLVEWIARAANEPAVESLPDAEVLALADSQMEEREQEELSDLLAGNEEGLLQEVQRVRLEELMRTYRRGLVRKAQALQTAVKRGLRPPIR